jgi:hypothetical protein
MVAAAHSWNLPASTMVARSRHLILMTSMAATTAGIPVQREDRSIHGESQTQSPHFSGRESHRQAIEIC